MFLPVEPESHKLAAIRPLEGAFALLDIVVVLTTVRATIAPGKDAQAVPRARLPFTFVLIAVAPEVNTLSLEFVFHGFSDIFGTVCVLEDTMPVLLAVVVLAIVPLSIFENFEADSMFAVIFPLSFVCVAIGGRHETLAVGSVILKVSFVDIAILIFISSLATEFVI